MRLKRLIGAITAAAVLHGTAIAQTMPTAPGCNGAVAQALVAAAQTGMTQSLGRIRGTFTAPQSLIGLSCLDTILQLANTSFNVPFDISGIENAVLSQAEAFACQALTSELNQVTSQFNVNAFFQGIPASVPTATIVTIPPSTVTVKTAVRGASTPSSVAPAARPAATPKPSPSAQPDFSGFFGKGAQR